MKLHPLSIPYRAVSGSLNLGTLVFLGTAVGSGSVGVRSLGFVGILLGYLLLMVAYQTAYYRRFEYAVAGETLEITSGVVSRRQREIPLRRVQNVDVSENPVQRALGIAAVRIETAGGGDTEAVLRYLDRAEADRLREDLRAPAREAGDPEGGAAREAGGSTAREAGGSGAGARGGSGAGATGTDAGGEAAGPAGSSAAEAGGAGGRDGAARGGEDGAAAGAGPGSRRERETLFELSTRELAILSLFTIDPGAGAISSVVAAVTSGGDPGNVFMLRPVVDALPGGRVRAAALALALVGVAAWLISVALTFARFYGFRLERVGDELEYERGLLQRYSGTIPVDKVQTVSLHENPLKRRFGYASLAVETAGYGPGSSGGGSASAVPLADRGTALAIAREIEGVEDATVERPPSRARRRYAARYLLAVGTLLAVGYGLARWLRVGAVTDPGPAALALPVALAALAPAVAHYTWVHRGHRVSDAHFVTRVGFWRRTTRVVPYYRIQTVVDSRSVFQRRRSLASVTADTASSSTFGGGGATAIDVDSGVADDLRGTLRERLGERLRERKRSARRRRPGGPAAPDSADPAAPDSADPAATDSADLADRSRGDGTATPGDREGIPEGGDGEGVEDGEESRDREETGGGDETEDGGDDAFAWGAIPDAPGEEGGGDPGAGEDGAADPEAGDEGTADREAGDPEDAPDGG